MDQEAAKAKELENWTRVAPGWRKHDERFMVNTAPATARLLGRAGVRAGQRVLDIASGTGEPAIPAAERVGPSGSVLGLDFVEDMLAFAREKAAARGLRNVEFRRQDGEQLDVPDASVDAVTMRWGLMFMPDPVACLRRALAALKPGGRIALSTWAGPEHNVWAALPVEVIKRHVELPAPAPGAPGLFAMADPERLRRVMGEAGFSDVLVEPLALVNMHAQSGSEYFQMFIELAGPIAALYARLTDDLKAVVAREIAAEADRRAVAGQVILTGVTWVASGQK